MPGIASSDWQAHLSVCGAEASVVPRGDAVVLPALEARALGYYFWYLIRRHHLQS